MKHPTVIQKSAQRVLRTWGLQRYLPQFLASTDGLALLAHLCNAGAKFFDPSLYDDKPILVRYAAERHAFAWHRDGVVYIETCVGQVSFHVFGREGRHLTERSPDTGPWAGGWMQDMALEMAEEFLGISYPVQTSRFDRMLNSAQPIYRPAPVAGQ